LEGCIHRTHNIRIYFNPDQFYYDPDNCGINIIGSGIHHGDLTGLDDNDHPQYASGVFGEPLSYSDQLVRFNYDSEYFTINDDGELDLVPFSVLPSGDVNDTLRMTTSGWMDTSILSTFDDGAGTTVDREDGTAPRYSNIIYVASGEVLPTAADYTIGTVLMVYVE
jgi:hypothetical protein